jgi:hypothetical protein
MTLEDLNERSFAELRTWLENALNGRVDLPRLTPDETPDVTILAAEDSLDKPTRRDLERACRELVRDFVRSGAGSLAYVRALLHLAAGLGQRELTSALVAMAGRFPNLPTLEVRVRQSVLLTIIDLKELQPVEFWWAMFAQDNGAYAGPVLTGLLAQDWQTGLQLLPRFPDDAMLANVAAVILDQALEDLTPAQRAACVGELQRIAPRCPPSMRQTLQELLAEHQGATRPPHTHARLNKVIAQKHPKRAQDIGTSLSSRVVPVLVAA